MSGISCSGAADEIDDSHLHHLMRSQPGDLALPGFCCLDGVNGCGADRRQTRFEVERHRA